MREFHPAEAYVDDLDILHVRTKDGSFKQYVNPDVVSLNRVPLSRHKDIARYLQRSKTDLLLFLTRR